MRARLFLAGAMVAAMTACGPGPLEETAAPEPVVTCNAARFSYLRGEPIEVVDTLDTVLEVRVLGPEEFVTRDYDPNRLTITESPDGNVSRVFCG